MTTARYVEHHIIRDLLRRRARRPAPRRVQLAERLITTVAVTAGLLLLGSYAPELLWALVGAAAVLTIGT